MKYIAIYVQIILRYILDTIGEITYRRGRIAVPRLKRRVFMEPEKSKELKRISPEWWLLTLPIFWIALLGGGCAGAGKSVGSYLIDFFESVKTPLVITWTAYSAEALMIAAVVYGFATAFYWLRVVILNWKNKRDLE
jgi:hypothetical protein